MSGEKPHEVYQRRRSRNVAVLVGLLGLCALLFLVTVLKLQEFAASPFATQFNPQIQLMQERAREQQ